MNEIGAAASGFIRSFRTPGLAKVLSALIAFSVTEWAAYIALAVYAFGEGGTSRVGLVSTLTLLVAAIAAPFGSVLGDRHRREGVLLLAYAGLTLATAFTATAMLLGLSPVVVYASAIVAAGVLTLVRPTHQALLPALAPGPRDLTAAYAASGLIESACVLLAPMVATVVFALDIPVSGPATVNVVLTAMLALGTGLVASMALGAAKGENGAGHAERSAPSASVAREAFAGVRTAWQDPRPRLLMGLVGLSTFMLGVIDISIVVLAFEVLGSGDVGVGLLNMALGIGSIAGAAAAAVVAGRRRLYGALRSTVIATGVPVAATAALPVAAIPLFGTSAAAMALGEVVGVTMLQRLIPDAKLTRVFGVLESMYMVGEGIGVLAASVSIIAIGPRWTLLVAGLLFPAVGFMVRHRLQDLDVGVRVPEHEIELLRRTPVFRVLPRPALERVARNAVPMSADASAVVIEEGAIGDRYFVIESGTAQVARGSAVVGSLEPGDGFGEIALLHDVPRTASVIASSDVRLLTLHRDEFLAALAGDAGIAAHQEAKRRMPGTDPPS